MPAGCCWDSTAAAAASVAAAAAVATGILTAFGPILAQTYLTPPQPKHAYLHAVGGAIQAGVLVAAHRHKVLQDVQLAVELRREGAGAEAGTQIKG